jgi:SAM-dependent methyltransferase
MEGSDLLLAADRRAGYAEISRLRQTNDLDEIVSLIPDAARSLLDMGCGSGALLKRAVGSKPGLERIAGLDVSETRIKETSELLCDADLKKDFFAADLLYPPELDALFDVVTMTSVLHWLHPREAEVFKWMATHLSQKGVLLMTTYRPSERKYGDSVDGIAKDALRLMGYEDAAIEAAYQSKGIIPLATRCAPTTDLKHLLRPWFDVERLVTKEVTVQTHDALEYRSYHVATYGRYYSRATTSDREVEFFDAVAKIAAERMERDGYVASMLVNSWLLRARK